MQSITKKELMTVETVKTSEFALACTLLHLGFQLENLETDPVIPNKIVFVFKFSEELDSAIDVFWNGGHVIEPKTFWNTARELKSRMRSTHRHAG